MTWKRKVFGYALSLAFLGALLLFEGGLIGMVVLGVGGIVFFVREFHTFTGNPVAMAIIVSLLVILLGMMAFVGAFGAAIMPYKAIKGWMAITRQPSPSHQSLGS